MIFGKVAGMVAAFAAIAAAAAVCIVAVAFALYAGLREVVGPAWHPPDMEMTATHNP